MTLALAPSSSDAEHEVCTALLESDVENRSVLFITLTGATTTRLRGSGADRGSTTVVRLGETLGDGATDDDLTVRAVSDPTNLTRLGIEFTEWLAETDGSEQVVCVHSLDALLQYVAADRLFRFFSVLSDHLREAGATAHVHADPVACDESSLATMRQLFDDVVEEERSVGE